MKSKILILFLILCLIMSVSAVSANEVNKTDKLTSTVTDVVSIEKADTNIQSNNKLNDVASNVDSNDDYSVIGATSIKNNITADICSNSVNKQSLSSDNDEILKDSSIGSFSNYC